jgi:hypothetical protein
MLPLAALRRCGAAALRRCGAAERLALPAQQLQRDCQRLVYA